MLYHISRIIIKLIRHQCGVGIDRLTYGTEHRTLETWFMTKLVLHAVREENELGQLVVHMEENDIESLLKPEG